MAKIILSMNGTVMREMVLSKGRITIGRGSQSDIVLDDLAISGHHAVIVTTGNDSYLEDLNSTNGTQVNGQPIRKHFLQDEDVIELARYRIRYLVELKVEQALNGKDEKEGIEEIDKRKRPAVQILKGSNVGKVIPLIHSLTTIGYPGLPVLIIARRSDGFYLSHGEGVKCPLVNGDPVSPHGVRLNHGDLVNLSGTQFRFLAD